MQSQPVTEAKSRGKKRAQNLFHLEDVKHHTFEIKCHSVQGYWFGMYK